MSQQSFNGLTAKFIATLIHAISGSGKLTADQMKRWFKLNDLLKERLSVVLIPPFPVWLQTNIGSGRKTPDGIISHLSRHADLSDEVEDVIRSDNYHINRIKREVLLVRVSPAELGFARRYITLHDFTSKALKVGLKLCDPEVLQMVVTRDPDYFRREPLTVAMKKVSVDDGLEDWEDQVLTVQSHGSSWAIGTRSVQYPELMLENGELWLFEAPPEMAVEKE